MKIEGNFDFLIFMVFDKKCMKVLVSWHKNFTFFVKEVRMELLKKKEQKK